MLAHLKRIPVFLFLCCILYPLIGLLCALSYLIHGDEDCHVVCTHHIRYQGCDGE
jgi:hypothetical protein